jgi:hypothetical protein
MFSADGVPKVGRLYERKHADVVAVATLRKHALIASAADAPIAMMVHIRLLAPPARSILRENRGVTCPRCGGEGCGNCNGGWLDVADLRGRPIPELPEAACREGIAYLATVEEKGRRKIVLGAAAPETVRLFMAGDLAGNLSGIYGDPARGFAGGYLDNQGVKS